LSAIFYFVRLNCFISINLLIQFMFFSSANVFIWKLWLWFYSLAPTYSVTRNKILHSKNIYWNATFLQLYIFFFHFSDLANTDSCSTIPASVEPSIVSDKKWTVVRSSVNELLSLCNIWTESLGCFTVSIGFTNT
jgi:uncharacterized circularly permuted ATP-grasp superfamily protein